MTDMMKIVTGVFQAESSSRAIIFVPTKKYTHSLRRFVSKVHPLLRPDVIVGRHATATGHGMTHVEQKEVIDRFCTGKTNLLIATSVAEEGLDVAECNLVIRYQYITNEIGHVQIQGRARADDSLGITIFSSDSKKMYRELKNEELTLLVNVILAEKPLPTGRHLREEIRKIQGEIMKNRRMKAALKALQKKGHTSSTIKLFCKSCKEFACLGSEIYFEGPHCTVPGPEFRKKITWKPHPEKCDMIPGKVFKTHKIHCEKCDRDWGVGAVWLRIEHAFPIIKSKAFTFEIGDTMRTIGRWSDVPFETKPLSDWLKNLTD